MDAPAGSRPVPLEHEDIECLMQARMRALARLQVACSPGHRASLEQQVAELDKVVATFLVATPPQRR